MVTATALYSGNCTSFSNADQNSAPIMSFLLQLTSLGNSDTYISMPVLEKLVQCRRKLVSQKKTYFLHSCVCIQTALPTSSKLNCQNIECRKFEFLYLVIIPI